MIKQLVIIYDNTINVRMQATRFASTSVLPALSPNALAQSRHKYLMVSFPIEHTIEY
jgi:hypothetical protein